MTTLTLVAVNIGMPKVIGERYGEPVLSGIDKRPVAAKTVMVGPSGIEGDGQADLENHGGIDKAVYAYPDVHWPWWEREKKLPCRPGLFGENLTVSGADESLVRIGDRFSWGEVVLEVCQPRAPCFKLPIHTGRADTAQAMTLSSRCGWYCRVIRDGTAPARGVLQPVFESDGPSVKEAFMAVFSAGADVATLRRIHQAPALSDAWRSQVMRRIKAANR